VPSVPKPFLMGQGQNRHPAHGTTLGSGDPQCSQESAASESESGFTLVELLIVIVILGILSGIVVFSVSGITSCGANAACNSDVASVTVASEAFYAQTGPIRRPSPRSCHNSCTQLLPPKPLPLPPPASSRRPPLLHRQVSLTVARGVPSSNRGTPTCQLIDRASIDHAMLGVLSQ
jgi:prepilin-type N-terminal cleavage/methylation domain-containing protein